MSRAARERSPAAGFDLPPLAAEDFQVSEASPDPAPGPVRDRLAAVAEERVRGFEDDLLAVLDGYLERTINVTLARLGGPRVRKGTRWWVDPSPAPQTEVKAIDAGYALPDRTVAEVAELVRPVGLSIVSRSMEDVARRMGRPGAVGLGDFDHDLVAQAIDEVVQRLLGVAQRHAAEIRRAIVDADATAQDLDEVLDRVRQAHRRGGNWVRLSGRTLAAAMANDAALAAAHQLGVTKVQWISRRDTRVRPTHRDADGQVRPIGEPFQVGRHRLRYPCDPAGLPDTWEEVAGCRCGTLIIPPERDDARTADLARRGTPKAARALTQAIATSTVARMATSPNNRLPEAVPAVHAPVDVVAHRVLDQLPALRPGQRLSWPGPLSLSTRAVPAAAAALVVVIPAGRVVGVTAATVTLPPGVALEIVSVTAEQIVARYAETRTAPSQ